MGAVQQIMLAQKISSAAWNPQTQGTLVNWYDASTLGLSNGANVTSWPDSKTGNPNPMSASANYPTYATNALNGLGVVNFAGGQYLPTGGSSAANTIYTFAAVVKITSSPAINAILGPSATGGAEFGTTSITPDGLLNAYNLASIGAGTTSLGATWHLLVITWSKGSSPAWAMYLDGSACGSGASSQSFSASTFEIGAAAAGAQTLHGQIGEIELYSSVLGSTDLTSLHTYIVNKWATP
jgi:hypothetical protein